MKSLISVVGKTVITTLLSVILLVAPVSATTTLDLVGQRIEGDYAAIDQFMVDTADPSLPKEQLIAEIEELETRLLESEELYQSYTITDSAEKQVEAEVRQITNALIETRKGVQTLKQGIQNDDPEQIEQALAQLEAASNTITTASGQLGTKIDGFVQEDQRTELLYIAAAVAAVAVTAGTFIARQRVNKQEEPLRFEALHRLFLQSLVPLAGVAITLGTFEYAKYTGASSYTITWGLMAGGLIYFIVEAFKYLTVIRPRLQEMKEVGMSQQPAESDEQKKVVK